MKKIQIIRGFNDILPQDSYKWQHLENQIKSVLYSYSFDEVRLPILEKSELFHRSVGETSDIVSKETYDFADRNGDNLTLRPEGTAGCVRMVVENNLANRGQTQKLWYSGLMFRYERPQKGRYRQFYQLGVEAYGFDGLGIDLEILSVSWSLFKQLGLADYITLELNSLGTSEDRAQYTQALLEYLEPYHDQLDADSVKRLTKNPLRILDSKVESTQTVLVNAPKLSDYINPEMVDQFSQTCKYVDSLGIKYNVNNNLVRGLDYYSGLVFEWTTDRLGAQSAICAGGRYDTLVKTLGGEQSGAIGFAIGMERLLLLLEDLKLLPQQKSTSDVFLVLDNHSLSDSLAIVFSIREHLPNIRFEMDTKFGSFKSQFKKASKSSAQLAVIIGADELENKYATVKYLQSDQPQEQVSFDDVVGFLSKVIV